MLYRIGDLIRQSLLPFIRDTDHSFSIDTKFQTFASMRIYQGVTLRKIGVSFS